MSLFAPSATSQRLMGIVRFNRVKYLLHRVSFRAFSGRVLTGLDCSHILHLGRRTGTNFNPWHIVEESNLVNSSRLFCALFIEKWEDDYEAAWADPSVSPAASFNALTNALAPCCSFIHIPRCLAWDPAWGDRGPVLRALADSESRDDD